MSGQSENKGVKALVLAAGLGSRLRPLTDTTPKCLVEVAGRPLLSYWFDHLRSVGIHDVLVNTHHLRDQVAAYLEEQRQSGFRAQEFFEEQLLGSAGTVAANREWMDDGDTCLVIYADNLSDVSLSKFLQFHEQHEEPWSMLLFRTDRPEQCGIAELDEEERIVRFEEKPEHPASNLANAGVYAISADAYREVADMQGHDLGFDVVPKFVGRMRGWIHDGYHLDVGNPVSLEKANQDAQRVFSLS